MDWFHFSSVQLWFVTCWQVMYKLIAENNVIIDGEYEEWAGTMWGVKVS